MSYKKSTYVVLALLLLLAVGYGWQALSFQDMRNRNSVGPSYFPVILAAALAILSLISAVQTYAQVERRIELSSLGLIGATLALTAAFLLFWSQIGHFYGACFVFVLALFLLYGPRRTLRSLAFKFILAAGVTLCIYLLFDLLIQLRF